MGNAFQTFNWFLSGFSSGGPGGPLLGLPENTKHNTRRTQQRESSCFHAGFQSWRAATELEKQFLPTNEPN